MSPAEIRSIAVTQPQPQGLAIQNWDDMMRIANFLSGSELIPVNLRKKPADVAIILMKGVELGFQPMQAIDSIDVIQGKPAVKPEAQLAMIYRAYPEADINIDTDLAKIKVTVTAARPGKTPQVFTWDMARAKLMGLDQKDNYKKQPLVMLKWRAIGEAARSVFPDVTRGIYNTEEAQDLETGTEGSILNDKGGSIQAALLGETPPKVDPPKDPIVDAEIVAPTPPKGETDCPLANYVIPIGSLKGTKLSSQDLAYWDKYRASVRKHYADNKSEAKKEWAELLARIDEYILSKDKAENKAPEWDDGPTHL